MDEERWIPAANNLSRHADSVEQSHGGIWMSAGSSNYPAGKETPTVKGKQ